MQEAKIPTDNYTLVIIGVVALGAFWLVFSLLRKVFGLILLAAMVIGGWIFWSNPELLQSVSDTVMRFTDAR